jgi:hypothetical protein
VQHHGDAKTTSDTLGLGTYELLHVNLSKMPPKVKVSLQKRSTHPVEGSSEDCRAFSCRAR